MSDDTPPALPPKADPETLVLRARTPRAVRFRRSVIVGAAAIGSIGLVAVTWTALKPVTFRHVAASEELSQPNTLSGSETLNRLPSNYGEAPRLGPPLPGDLGRPIIEHQRALAGEIGRDVQENADQAAAAERERRLADIRSARQSPLLFQNQPRSAPSQGDPQQLSVPSDSPSSGVGAAPPLDPTRDPNAQAHKMAFVSKIDDTGDINPHLLTPAPSPYLLSAGSVISASLITGLRSDLPGLVTAQVTERVYDSATGRILLIPQGARLVGSYDSVVAFGQRRALIVWQRIIMPDGSSLRLDNVPATDAAGYAGLADKVDFHTWTLLKGIALSTLLGVGSELALSGDSDLVQAIRLSTQDSGARAGDQITSRNLNIQPTITIRSGASVRMVVHKDLVLSPWRG